MKMRGLLLSLASSLSLLVSACAVDVANVPPGRAPEEDESAIIEPPSEETGPAQPSPPPSAAGPTCEATSPRTKPLELFIQPEVGTAPFVNAINAATKSVDVMVYQMGYGPILEGLEAKARAGVRVRVILDLAQKRVNEKYMNRLVEAGANVIWSDPQFVFMHAKVIIADGAEAIISTGNYSESYMLKERNFAVRNTDPADLEVLNRLFEADFARKTPDLSCTRLIVAPVNARQRIVDFIGSAKKSIVVESMQLGDKDVRDALAARKAAGVDVRAVLADPSWIDANASAATFLKEHNIEARWMKNVHVKSIVVDGESAYVGSVNLSWNSINKNREIGLLVNEEVNVKSALTTFEKDWNASTPF